VGAGADPGRLYDRRLWCAVTSMFGARARASPDLSWLLPNKSQSGSMPTDLTWLFPNGAPQIDQGPDPFGDDRPSVPPGASSTLSQKCLDALQVTNKSPADVARVQGLMPTFRAAAAPYPIDPRMLAAIALRETGGRNIAEIGPGGGMGVFQLTHQPISTTQAYNNRSPPAMRQICWLGTKRHSPDVTPASRQTNCSKRPSLPTTNILAMAAP